MALWTLKKERFLVVDDFPEMRSLLRTLLIGYGAQDIKQARNGAEAIEQIEAHPFDIILCDYNLGEGRDGQQVLEESKHRGLLPSATLFIMVTAENTSDMVMGALDYQPDEYLSKPITKNVLQLRLSKLLERRDRLAAIHRLQDQGRYDLATARCEALLNEGNSHRQELLKLKCDLLFASHAHKQVIEVCNGLLQEREIPWARMNLGKAYFHLNELEQARATFSGLTEAFPTLVAAWDWLASTEEKLGDTQAAQHSLMQAVEISPRSVMRQRKLAEAAEGTHDLDVSEKARRQVLRVGRNSVLKQPTDYTGLAGVLIQNDRADEALKVVDKLSREMCDHPATGVQAALTESLVHQSKGDADAAGSAIQRALDLYAQQDDDLAPDVGMDLARACLANGRQDEADSLVRDLVLEGRDDDRLTSQIEHIYRDAGLAEKGNTLVDATRREVTRVNNEGVRLAEQGKLEESIQHFDEALKSMPANPVINLNAAHTLLTLISNKGGDQAGLRKLGSYLQVAGQHDPGNPKFQRLRERFRQVAQDMTR